MESLYRKYRPLTFESVVGQQHIVSTLRHAVSEGRLSHAYLFCGPRGTGKTTMARILAKSLLCQGAEAARAAGGSGCMPDGTCPECEAIAAGTHPDVYELDAASRTGVDNVREEIISSVSFAPVRGAYKVYIIDEVHMLTTQAFNALLKTLEEPPSHVIFVLCTTDPQKILETILSRCQRFDFHRISNEDIVGRLQYICEQEGFSFDEGALEIVAKHARGGMRDALSTLEQLSVFGDGSVRVDDARALLGEVASTVLAEFSCKMAVRDTVGLFVLVRSQVDEGNDLLELTRDLVAHIRDVYTAAIAGPRPELFDGTPEEVSALVEEARSFGGSDRLARALTVLDDAALEMRNASDPRLVLEIALTRLARPESDLTLESLAERIAGLEAQIAAGVPSGPMSVEQLAAATKVTPAPISGRPAAPAPPRPAAPRQSTAPQDVRPETAVPVGKGSHDWKNLEKPESISSHATGEASAAPVPAPEPAPAPVATTVQADSQPAMAACTITPPASDAGDLQRRWADAVKRITAAQPSRGGLLQSSRAVSDDGQTLTISFPKGSTFALKMISRTDSCELVMPIICEVFGKRSVTYEMEGGATAAGGSGGRRPALESSPVESPVRSEASATPVAASSSVGVAPTAPAATRAAEAPAAAHAIDGAPAGTLPASARAVIEPAPDQASGPTMLPDRDIDADRRAWEDEQPPYDDPFIDSLAGDSDRPPIDLPTDVPSGDDAVSAVETPVRPNPALAGDVDADAFAGASDGDPACAATGASDSGESEQEDPKEVLQGIWGNVIFK